MLVWLQMKWTVVIIMSWGLVVVTKHRTGRNVRTGPKYSDILHWISSKSNKYKSEMRENRNLFFS